MAPKSPPTKQKDPLQRGKLVLIIGPSGVGKSVILQRLRSTCPSLHFPRSATTRKRREGEGDDLYRFVSDAEFDRSIATDALLEWATVHEGARYGTLIDEIIPWIRKGKIVVREVDVQGFQSISNHMLFAGKNAPYRLQSIFILPESKEQLIVHITKRSAMSPEEFHRRLGSMERELSSASACSARVINREGKLRETLKEVESLIFTE
ncbi:hypothetical protein HY285_05865 [Candidatus Peregrinibacteria bacterium]|nr:hypothetical protein [Candidatus Peregrinibacteria bacterium]MBI3817034.1 hypothetical protein [Candidatus Peregrinibacteria bacterium]